MNNVVLEVNRPANGTTRLVESELPPIEDGQVRLKVDRFALTANNITYAAVGDMLGYWEFFPPSEAGEGAAEWGRVPCIGWADVIESNHPDIAVGGRYFGWFPMAQFVDITASPTESGIRDDGPHRQAHAPTYRNFMATTSDPMYPAGASGDALADLEDRHVLLRGLFLTGFLIDEFIADLDGGTPEQVVLLSASSKTAIAVAQRVKARGLSRAVGVTSAGNVDFVRSLGWYDDVVTYDSVATLPMATSAVVDMSGDSGAVAAVHDRLGDLIATSLIVGKSHHDAAPAMVTAGPAQEFFFAPSEVERRTAEWGADEYRRRCAEAITEFVAESPRWLTIEHRTGAVAVQDTWNELFANAIAPSTGLVVSLND